MTEGGVRTFEEIHAQRAFDIEGRLIVADVDVSRAAQLRVIAIMNSENNQSEGE